MSQLNDIMVRIAAIQIGINVPGLPIPCVLQAEPYQPTDISSASLPIWINEIRGGPSDLPVANGQQYRTTNVYMMLCVARKEANIDLKYGVAETAQWVDAVYSTFSQHVRLSAPAVNIKSSTNANPIRVTTAVPHGFVTGDQASISGHLVNTNANGSWNVTVVDYLNFTVPTAGNGVGVQTGATRLLQPANMSNIEDAIIQNWDLVNYIYGSTEFLALQFILRVREFYVTTMTP